MKSVIETCLQLPAFVLMAAALGCGPDPQANQGATQTKDQPTAVPQVPDETVFRPAFSTTLGDIQAGTAFAVSLAGFERPVVITALHLLGPSGGLAEAAPAGEVGSIVSSLTLEPCFGEGGTIPIAAEALPIDQAAPLGEDSPAGDIVAFWAPAEAAIAPRELAGRQPQVGERVWLAAQVIAGAPADKRTHGATVVDGGEPNKLWYHFDNAEIELRATSGAPVLNSRGEVVAINLGGGSDDSGVFGVGNPVSVFGSHLEEAARNSSAATRGPRRSN